MSETTSQLINCGIGKWRGTTLIALEGELARMREKGAPDNASVIRVPGSVYLAEVQWIKDSVPIWWAQ